MARHGIESPWPSTTRSSPTWHASWLGASHLFTATNHLRHASKATYLAAPMITRPGHTPLVALFYVVLTLGLHAIFFTSTTTQAWPLQRQFMRPMNPRTAKKATTRRPRRFDRRTGPPREQTLPFPRNFDSSKGLQVLSTAASPLFARTKPFRFRLEVDRNRFPHQDAAPFTRTNTDRPPTVTHVQQLQHYVLDQRVPLKQLKIDFQPSNVTNTQLLDHQVVQLIRKRFQEQSIPGHRKDNATLALSIEGGGMRGAVSAGMAAAISALGLADAFDAIYGSSAGSVVGSYLVSRQMCLDVYVDILPAAQRTFVCTKRMLAAIFITGIDGMLGSRWYGRRLSQRAKPGMNLTFVLDGIMHHEHGLRPLDLEQFLENDRKQPLRIATSYVQDGHLATRCFGTQDFHRVKSGTRQGLYPCLEASMTVPGATGPPVQIFDGNNTLPYFDAFCFEPLPYRSAVEDGATHVMVLCSRPEGFQPTTKPGVYERAIAPIYFKSHGEPDVAKYFENGGQQYIYAEDLLTLEEGKNKGMSPDAGQGVRVPPPRVLYGTPLTPEVRAASSRDSWKKAHLLPLKVPLGTPELPTLEQGREPVLEAVRGGFAAAFDQLAPAAGIDTSSLRGINVAKIVFPDECMYDESLMHKPLRVRGDKIGGPGESVDIKKESRSRRLLRRILSVAGNRRSRRRQQQEALLLELRANEYSLDDPRTLLNLLPGLRSRKLMHMARALHELP